MNIELLPVTCIHLSLLLQSPVQSISYILVYDRANVLIKGVIQMMRPRTPVLKDSSEYNLQLCSRNQIYIQ